MLAHAAEHRVIGFAEPPLRFDPMQHLRQAVGRDRRHHAHEFGHGEIGAEGE
jgi:hypothetical protein